MFSDQLNPDFGDALKLAMEAETPVAPMTPEPDMARKNTSVVLRELKQLVTNLKNGLVQALTDLDNRMAAKMQELTSSQGSMADTTAELRQRVEELSKEFENKSQEVDSVLSKVMDMLPEVQGDLKLSQAVDKLAAHLNGLKKELTGKAKEAERLRKDLDKVNTTARANMSSLQQQLYDLDDYSQEVESKLEKAYKIIEDLESKKNDLERMKIDKSALHNNPKNPLDLAHNKPFGNFNLQEHLERARKSQKDNTSWH